MENYDSVLTINPDQTEALTDRGAVLAELDRFDEALETLDRALRLAPHVIATHVNRGNALLKLTRMDEALACYDQALAIDPEHAEANFNAALTRLCMGDFRAGWTQYEYRWQKKDFALRRRDFPQPIWRGEEGPARQDRAARGRAGSRRYHQFRPLRADGGSTRRQGHSRRYSRSLKALAATVPEFPLVLSDGEALPAFDLYCPLLSLPLAFETELETVLGRTFSICIPTNSGWRSGAAGCRRAAVCGSASAGPAAACI